MFYHIVTKMNFTNTKITDYFKNNDIRKFENIIIDQIIIISRVNNVAKTTT